MRFKLVLEKLLSCLLGARFTLCAFFESEDFFELNVCNRLKLLGHLDVYFGKNLDDVYKKERRRRMKSDHRRRRKGITCCNKKFFVLDVLS